MTDGPINQSGQGPTAERRLHHAPEQCFVAPGHAALIAKVRSVRTSGIPVPRRSAKAPATGRSLRGNGSDHAQGPGGNGTSSSGLCEKKRTDDRYDRDTRVGCVSEYSEKAWLSRAKRMARFKFTLTICLIACTTRNSSRPTVFWCPFGSMRSAAV